MNLKNPILASLPLGLLLSITATGESIIKGDVTATLGPDFFFNTAAVGGGDNSATEFNRDYDGAFAGKAVTFTGIGWASPAGGTTAAQCTATFTDLGPDNTFGTADDVFLGSVNDPLTFSGAGTYHWKFSNAIGGVLTGNIVRIRMFQGSPIVRKTTSGNGQANVKLSLAGTAVTVVDLDNDSIHDPWETNTGTWVSVVDTGTDPNDDDSDNDTLLDGWEKNSGIFVNSTNTGTDPNKFDTDNDSFSDGIENNSLIFNGPTDPGTNPNMIDTDGDTYNENIENGSGIYNGPTDPGTDPTKIDTDNDGLNDNIENNSGIYNGPNDPGTNPNFPDSEDNGFGDGMDDGWEVLNGTDPNSDDSAGDPDSDDLDNLGEYNANSDPQDPDSDNDTLSDGIEANPAVIGFTDTDPINRDTDGDRLSDGVETNTGNYVDRSDTGSNPNLANSDADIYPDGIEVLFYGSNPNLDTSFPGDGLAPAPGSLTPILDGGNPINSSATLGSTIIDEAATGGGDFNFFNGNTNFVALYPNAFPAPGTNVSLTGFAWVVTAAGTTNGDVLVEFYDPGAGNFTGIDQATFLGSAVGTLTTTGATTVMYLNFANPINFTSASTALAVRIQSTAGLRIKAQDNVASGQWQALDGSGTFGNIRTSRFSIGGTTIGADLPKIQSITRIETSPGVMTTTVTWTLGSAASVNLERSTDLGASDPWSDVLTNTTNTSYQETSGDSRAFFRIVSP